MSFAVWLSGYPIIDDRNFGKTYNRLELIKLIANSGGATHYPEKARAHFSRLQDVGVEATRYGLPTKIKFRDFEKHTLRQVAHELLVSVRADSKPIQAEAGALVLGSHEALLYPGRKLWTSVDLRKAESPNRSGAAMVQTSLNGLVIKLPYEGTADGSACPCDSGEQFEGCCKQEREFSAAFVEDFERKHGFGQFRPVEASRKPGD